METGEAKVYSYLLQHLAVAEQRGHSAGTQYLYDCVHYFLIVLYCCCANNYSKSYLILIKIKLLHS